MLLPEENVLLPRIELLPKNEDVWRIMTWEELPWRDELSKTTLDDLQRKDKLSRVTWDKLPRKAELEIYVDDVRRAAEKG